MLLTRGALIASSEKGAAREVRRDSRPAIIFNSWSAPIVASRSMQASMVRAFFKATSNTCVRLSIIASPRSFRRWRTTRQTPASVPASLAPARRDARPAFAGGAVGGECNLIILDAGDVLHDAFAVRGPRIDAESKVSPESGHLRPLFPHSSFSSRFTAGASTFFILSQLGERPER